MLCNVSIKGAEGSEEVTCQGELDFVKNGFDLTYKIAEDRCVLSLRGGTVTQSRRGSIDTDITFAKGKNTICMLLSGELTGSIPVKTVGLDVITGDNGVALTIEYFLGGAKIILNLTAFAAQKEQI